MLIHDFRFMLGPRIGYAFSGSVVLHAHAVEEIQNLESLCSPSNINQRCVHPAATSWLWVVRERLCALLVCPGNISFARGLPSDAERSFSSVCHPLYIQTAKNRCNTALSCRIGQTSLSCAHIDDDGSTKDAVLSLATKCSRDSSSSFTSKFARRGVGVLHLNDFDNGSSIQRA